MLFRPKHFNLMTFEAEKDKGAGGTGTPPAGDPPENSGKAAVTFESQEAFEAKVTELLKERLERERKKSADAAAKAAADAEADAAKKNGEWQKLAEQREKELGEAVAKLTELDALKGNFTRYEGTLKKFLEAQRKDLPAHILSLLDKLDPVDQLDYITANAEALRKTGEESKPRPLGTPPGKQPAGGNKPKTDGVPVVRMNY